MESDAIALEYLASYDYDVDKALFRIMCDLGSSKDGVYCTRTGELIDKYPSAAVFTETKERVLRSSKGLLGSYEHSESRYSAKLSLSYTAQSSSLQSAVKEEKQIVSEAAEKGVIVSDQIGSELVGYNRDYSSMTFPRKIESMDATISSISLKSPGSAIKADIGNNNNTNNSNNASSNAGASGRSRGQEKDKTEIKKRWQNVLKRCQSALSSMHTFTASLPAAGMAISASKCDSRPNIETVQEILDEAASLPVYINSPGEDFAETVRGCLGELLVKASEVRDWVAIVHDVLSYYSKNMNVVPIISELKQILNDGERQPLATPEEQKLKECLSLHDKIGKECRKILVLTNYVDAKEDVGDGMVIDGDEEMKTSVKNKRGNKDMDPSTKPLIEQVSNILNSAKRVPFLCKEVPCVEDMYRKGIKLAEEVQMFFERAQKCLVRKPPATSTRAVSDITKSLRIPIENSKALLEEVRSFPLYIPLQNELADVIAKGEEWSREVRTMAATASDKSSATLSITGRPSRNIQTNVSVASQSVASNKPVSLKRVESLISDGEKMPFEFTLELEILKEKKNQAKLWFERVKSKFPKSKAASSLRNKSGGEGATSEKINFSDMKLIVEEGEVLFDDSQGRSSKELSKVQSVVEEAEVWLSRVREALTDAMNQPIDESIYDDNDDAEDDDDDDDDEEKGNDDDDMETDDSPKKKNKKRNGTIDMLQELLAEADEMPVFMEEALVLRSHLNAIEWSKKARPILAMPTAAVPFPKSSRLVEIQKLAKEINKIRQVVPSHIWDDFPIKQLKEEIFCLNIVSKSDKILNTIKRITEKNNVLKKGILLDKVISIYNDARSIHVNLDYELRPLKTAISATEEWIKSNETVLQKLGIPIVTLKLIENFNDTFDADNNRVWNNESMCWEDSVDTGSRISDTAAMTNSNDSTLVEFSVLQSVIENAAGIVTEFPELSECRLIATNAAEWLDRMNELLPKKDTSIKPKTPKSANIDSNEIIKRVDINDLVLLLSAAEDFKLNFDKEKETIQESMEKATVWNQSALVSLQTIQTKLKTVLDSYRSLLCKSAIETESSEDILSHLPFACVRGIKNIGDTSDKEEDDEDEDDKMEVANDSVNGENGGEDDEASEVSPLINVEPVEMYENNESNKQTRDTEDSLYTQLVDIADEIDLLQKDGNDIGINTEASVMLDVYMSSLNWICEARTILLVNSDTFSTVNKLGGNQSSKDWGDTTKENIRVIIEDALELVDANNNWSSLYDQYYFNSLLEGTSLDNLNIDTIPYTSNVGTVVEKAAGATVASSVKQSERAGKNNNATVAKGALSASKGSANNKNDKAKKKKDNEDSGKGNPKGKNTKKKNSKASNNDAGDEMVVADDSDDNNADDELGGDDVMEEDELNASSALVVASAPENELFSKPSNTPSSKVSKANFKSLATQSMDMFTVTTKSFTYTKHLAPHADAFNTLNLKLPTVVEEYFDMYTRLLGVLLNRLDEVERWSLVTKKVITRGENASYGASAKDNRANILYLINWANRRYIYCTIRRTLESHINNYNTWVLRVNQMKLRKKEFLLSLNDLKEFIKTGKNHFSSTNILYIQ